MFAQAKSFKDVEKRIDKLDNKLDLAIQDVSAVQIDDEDEMYPLTFKDKIIEHHKQVRSKFKPKYIIYPVLTTFLLGITATTTYYGLKLNKSKHTVVVTSSPDSKITSLFDDGITNPKVEKELNHIRQIDVLKNMTTWGGQNNEPVVFNNDLIRENFLPIIEPSVSVYNSKKPIISIMYSLLSDKHLLAEIRWCKIENEKIVGNVYYDTIEITL